MASCMQHLYMMPEARNSILKANSNENAKHWQTLKELQRMFAYLMVTLFLIYRTLSTTSSSFSSSTPPCSTLKNNQTMFCHNSGFI